MGEPLGFLREGSWLSARRFDSSSPASVLHAELPESELSDVEVPLEPGALPAFSGMVWVGVVGLVRVPSGREVELWAGPAGAAVLEQSLFGVVLVREGWCSRIFAAGRCGEGARGGHSSGERYAGRMVGGCWGAAGSGRPWPRSLACCHLGHWRSHAGWAWPQLRQRVVALHPSCVCWPAHPPQVGWRDRQARVVWPMRQHLAHCLGEGTHLLTSTARYPQIIRLGRVRPRNLIFTSGLGFPVRDWSRTTSVAPCPASSWSNSSSLIPIRSLE